MNPVGYDKLRRIVSGNSQKVNKIQGRYSSDYDTRSIEEEDRAPVMTADSAHCVDRKEPDTISYLNRNRSPPSKSGFLDEWCERNHAYRK